MCLLCGRKYGKKVVYKTKDYIKNIYDKDAYYSIYNSHNRFIL